MQILIFKTIFQAYISLLVILTLVFYKELSIFIILQNTFIFLIISTVIYKVCLHYNMHKFTRASHITFIRIILSIVMLSLALNSFFDTSIYGELYFLNIFIFLAFIALILDGADGFIARKYKESNSFGIAFDQEADNLMLLILSLSIYLNKNINIIIFLIPIYRYIFILFMYRFLWLKRELPKSFLRKFICIFTSILLIISHISYLDEYIVINIVFFALFIITFSFAKDIIWLYRKKNENM